MPWCEESHTRRRGPQAQLSAVLASAEQKQSEVEALAASNDELRLAAERASAELARAQGVEQNVRGHHLGHGRRRHLLPGVLFIKNLARFGINDDGLLGVGGDSPGQRR